MLRKPGHALALGEILPDQAVGVFVGAAFPRMGRGEVEAGAGRLLDRRVAMELRPVVRRNRPDRAGLAPNQRCRAPVHFRRRAAPDPARHEEV